jgi:hypothetical protein
LAAQRSQDAPQPAACPVRRDCLPKLRGGLMLRLRLGVGLLGGFLGSCDLGLRGIEAVTQGIAPDAVPFPPRLFPIALGPQAVDDEDQPLPFLVASVSAGALTVDLLAQHGKRDLYGLDMPGLR